MHLVKILVLRGEGFEFPISLPLLLLLLFGHVLIIDVGATASKGAATSAASSFFFESLDPHFVNDSLSVFSEHSLDSGHAAGHLDDVSHEIGDLLL